MQGKIMTIIYALYGIPVFLWYIIKLGALFRVVVMRFLRNVADCWKFSVTSCFPRRDRKNLEAGMQNLVNATARPIVKDVSHMWLVGFPNPNKMEQSWEYTFLKLYKHKMTK